MSIFIARNGAQLGPFEKDGLAAAVGNGSVSLSDLAWSEGEAGWVALTEYAAKHGLSLGASGNTAATPPPPPPITHASPVTTRTAMDTVKLVYYLFLGGILTAGISTVVGVVFAYVNRREADGKARSHFDFQIGTFWKSAIASFGLTILAFIVSGIAVASAMMGGFISGLLGILAFLVYVALFVFGIAVLVRVVKGLMIAQGDRAIANPSCWVFPKG